tara:strand:- start:1059 stop:1781 length:723 start_codon:yes stop_codon:yes gene_type:complete
MTMGELAVSIFKKHDKNGNGNLEKAELVELVKDFTEQLDLTLSAAEHDNLINTQFAEADKNNDGTLSYDEFVQFADQLDQLSSSLGGSVDKSAEATGTEVPRGNINAKYNKSMKSSMVDAFHEFDTNQDKRLDVSEAEQLLKTKLSEWDITTEWVTQDWIRQQFRSVTGEGDGDKTGDVALDAEEFQVFIKQIMNFVCHLGGAMERTTPAPAAEPPQSQEEEGETPGETPRKGGGCGCFG